MDLWTSIAIGIGLSAACGFRVFVPLLLMSAAAQQGVLPLTEDFAWLRSSTALWSLAAASGAEVVGYYIPWVDNLLDTIATPAAMIAGTLASASVFGADMSPFLRWALAVIAGGGAAGLVQGGTVAARGTSTATTGGTGNFIVATLENIFSVLTSLLALAAPFVALLAIIGGSLLMIRWLWRRRHRSAPSP